MAYDEELANRVRLLLGGLSVDERRMFGGLAFLLNRHMAVAVSGQGGLMVRVEPGQLPALLAEPGAAVFEMQGRAMKGWLRVSADAVQDDAALRSWVERGMAYAGSLPPK